MKLFKFDAKEPGYDEFEGFVIIADTKKEAWDIFDDKFGNKYSHESDHKNWVIKEIDMLKKGIISSSFRLG
jgi:hypothetical protein